MKTIVIAGASGFIGAHLSRYFESLGWKVKTIGRSNSHGSWDNPQSIVAALEAADAVVNLAGKSVNCRFSKANVDELIRSRVDTTRAIGEAIVQCVNPPQVWVNASGASIYREHVGEANTELSPTDGEGVMAEVARLWEAAFFESKLPTTRKVALRISLVLGDDGGVWPILKRLARFGLGGKQGSGKQMMSWIHIKDLCSLIQYIVEHEKIVGLVNAASPGCISNREFMKVVRTSVGRKWGWPASTLEIKLGTALLGVPPELILRGMWVRSRVEDFNYTYSDLRMLLY